jgi:anti-sigma-K factor RskA
MSDEDTIGAGDRSDLTAAEYVLGLLSAENRRAAEFRIASEPKFAAEVAFWEARLGGLADSVAPVVPPAHVWQSIERRLSASIVSAPERSSIWNSLNFWRTFAIASAGLAAASMAGLAYLAQVPSLGPPLLATLDEQSGQPGFLAAANPADGSVTIVPAALLTAAQQQSYELWVIPPGGKPHSLGLVDPKRPVKVVVPPELLPHVTADSTLAISIEPVGGSPTGQPTGPVIANGKLASL